ncbi:chemotaxis protein, partial [Shewanella sp.]|nr:chemotaxis protein [Shewanella sp.]
MKSIRQVGLFMVISMLIASCSLLELKLESGEPLPKEQLNMRVFSRDFSRLFYSQVESAAETIEHNSESILITSNALMWKINAEQNLQYTVFQTSPTAAMLDTWVFMAQMAQFFSTGAGNTAFGDQQQVAVNVSVHLLQQLERTIEKFGARDFAQNQAFIQQYVAKHPIRSLSFSRQSAYSDWLEYNKVNELDLITTFGSVPEVMSDISDKMAMIAEQTPKILGWKIELYALHSNINADKVQATLISISDTSAKFQQLMAQSPEMIAALAGDLRHELSPLLQQLNRTTDGALEQLSLERQALQLMVTAEREALEQ